MLTKKDFIHLADSIRENNRRALGAEKDRVLFDANQLETLADFCQESNPNFKRDRWLDYIAGHCGPNGGAK